MKTSKIGILTFHNASNYGAALQAYATLKVCQQLGYTAEIIDYTNSYRSKKYSALSRILEKVSKRSLIGTVKMILASPGVILRNATFDKFYAEHLVCSDNQYNCREQLINNLPGYESVISGSDQIWSSKNNGADTSYLLDFVPTGTKKISYASSFGMLEINDELRSDYAQCLSSFDYLSTREQSGVELIKQLTNRDAKLVLDPVFLHSKSFWLNLSKQPRTGKVKKFDLLYLNDNCHRNHRLLNNIKNTCISIGSFKFEDIFNSKIKICNQHGPEEFIYYINHAQTVYTTSFHAIVLCMIFNTPFYAFLSGDAGRDSRLKQILEKYDLGDRIVSPTLEEVQNDIDFTLFNQQWEIDKLSCLDYLSTSLEGK